MKLGAGAAKMTDEQPTTEGLKGVGAVVGRVVRSEMGGRLGSVMYVL